ncbi:uncharacterized protein LOC122650780 [Telopea speciosissima]|uniref:uncharacterized protein LOC122650780 n=1 Tax=Telopea speciosissima TaxID=54955 RepID=UPI001CC720C1|nr:uncharacterized protein LOC122650780 [Telopea speciosissima]
MAIRQIKLPLFPCLDKQVWGAASKGIFSTKSTYHLLLNLRDYLATGHASSSNRHKWEDVPTSVWKRIWHSTTLPKIKNFLWRIYVDGIACGDNLARRNISIDPGCCLCGYNLETCDHLLFECPFPRAVWFGSNLSFLVSNIQPSLAGLLTGWDKFPFPSKDRGKEVLCLVSFVCWHIWLARNHITFTGIGWSPEEVISRAQSAFQEFWDISTTGKGPTEPVTQHLPSTLEIAEGWQCPPTDYIKINCDAALPLDSTAGGLGFIARDHNGSTLTACSEPIFISNALLGEALAVRAGLYWANQANIPLFIVESDCSNLISILIGGNSHPLDLDGVIHDILRLAESFSSCSFVNISRDVNVIAHHLARKALSATSRTIWPLSNPWLLNLCNQESLSFACPLE